MCRGYALLSVVMVVLALGRFARTATATVLDSSGRSTTADTAPPPQLPPTRTTDAVVSGNAALTAGVATTTPKGERGSTDSTRLPNTDTWNTLSNCKQETYSFEIGDKRTASTVSWNVRSPDDEKELSAPKSVTRDVRSIENQKVLDTSSKENVLRIKFKGKISLSDDKNMFGWSEEFKFSDKQEELSWNTRYQDESKMLESRTAESKVRISLSSEETSLSDMSFGEVKRSDDGKVLSSYTYPDKMYQDVSHGRKKQSTMLKNQKYENNWTKTNKIFKTTVSTKQDIQDIIEDHHAPLQLMQNSKDHKNAKMQNDTAKENNKFSSDSDAENEIKTRSLLYTPDRSNENWNTDGTWKPSDDNWKLSDDNWKQGLYTNRTLHRDQDPLHMTWQKDSSEMSLFPVNYTGTGFFAQESSLHAGPCCDDCLQTNLKTSIVTDTIEMLAELIMLLELQEDCVNSPCVGDQGESGVDASCVMGVNDWKA